MRKNFTKKTTTDVPSWDLSDLYSGTEDPKIERDVKQMFRAAVAFERNYKGKVSSLAAKRLYEALTELERINERATKPSAFAHLLFNAHTNEKNRAFSKRMDEKWVETSKRLLFFNLELMKLPEGRMRAILKSPELARYAHHLSRVYDFKKHTLSEAEEKIIVEKDITGSSAFVRLFEETTTHSKFEIVKDGKKRFLNESQVLALLHSPDRTLRKAAAASLTQGLAKNSSLYSFVYNTLVQDKAIDDRLRNYSYPQKSRHLANEVTKEVVDIIKDVCAKNYGVVSDYYRLKKEILGYKDLFDYDRHAPITAEEKKISFEETKRIVLASFERFLPVMKEIAQKFFDSRWIDGETRDGKCGGAFCSYTTTDAHPYVFMNYLGQPRDVMTLGHELGHGVHAYVARMQGYFSFHSPLVLAETASVFAEVLVFHSLKETIGSEKERLALLCGKIEDVFSTVFRQIVMYQFECDVHEKRRKTGEDLPAEQLNDLWLSNNKKMFGNSVRLTDDYGFWWMYIPHFIDTPFYVYAYPFGELLSLSLYARYQKEGKKFAEKYLELLKAGGSEEPAALLQRLGIDISRREFWQAGMNIIKEMVAEARRLHQAKLG